MCLMLNSGPDCPMYRAFITSLSDVLFRIAPGEAQRLIEHLLGRGAGADEVRRSRRRYFRRNARYRCPEPEVLVRDLYNLYMLFDVEHPTKPGSRFYIQGHEELFKKELKYVQLGFLSNPPDVPMYMEVGKGKHGLVKYRCMRTSSALEGYHQHFVAAQDCRAKSVGPRFANARSRQVNFAWNVRGKSWFRSISRASRPTLTS